MQIPFGEWTPDLPDHQSEGVSEAKNVVPGLKGYKPQNSFTTLSSDAISARCRGAISMKAADESIATYSGSATKLYELGATSHTDRTNTGGDYDLENESYWSFIKWGNQVIASAVEENPQIITIGGSNFADLSGSPPKAKYCAVIGDFVVLGYISTDPQKLHWSGINDATDWTANADTQSDTQVLRSNQRNGGGLITGIKGSSEYGIVFQEYTMHRFNYVGSPTVFDFEEILPGVGTQAPNSISQEGQLIHFLGTDGFIQLVNGSQVNRIGDQKIDATFLADLDSDYHDRVIGASDPQSSLVYWIYPGSGSSLGVPNKYIVYNWYINKWAHGELDLEWIYSALSEGYTLEELDSVSTSLDALGASLDSEAWSGGVTQLSAYNTSDKAGVLQNTALSALVETGEMEINPVGRSRITGVRPIVETGTPTAQVGTRNLLSDEVSYTTAGSPNTHNGFVDLRSDSRYHRFRVNTSGAFTEILGIDIKALPIGTR